LYTHALELIIRDYGMEDVDIMNSSNLVKVFKKDGLVFQSRVYHPRKQSETKI